MTDVSIEPLPAEPSAERALEVLLTESYVAEGYTDPEVGVQMFRADAVRARGEVLAARDHAGILLGTVTTVLPGSPAIRLATGDEAELHLLCVAPAARGRGVGHALVGAAINSARAAGASRLLLWTQVRMHAAQRLYLRAGFSRVPAQDFVRGSSEFLVYARTL